MQVLLNHPQLYAVKILMPPDPEIFSLFLHSEAFQGDVRKGTFFRKMFIQSDHL